MKAEHRKELQTNVLADSLGRAIRGIKEGPSRNTVLVAVLVLLAVALFLVWRYFSASAAEGDSDRWVQLDSLATPEQLDKFVDNKDLQGTSQVRVATFMVARLKLSQGLRELAGPRRGQAQEDIRKAAQTYEKLAADSGDWSRENPLLPQEALLGAAKAYEALGELATAKGFYQKLKDSHPGSTFAHDADEQLKRLESSKDLPEVAKEYKAPEPR
jgi:hypothetical protein